jgi:hypothetical protein
MTQENKKPDAPALRALAAVNGSIEFTVTKRDGTNEKVRIQQLPIRLLGDWARLIDDEAALVELYCDKIDRDRAAKLLKLSGELNALSRMQQECKEAAELEKISGEVNMTRAELLKINGEPRWDDTLSPDSHDEIVKIGYELNRPRFDLWLSNRHNAIGHLKDVYRQYLPEHPLLAAGKERGAMSAEVKPGPEAPNANGSATSSPTPAPSSASQST